MLKFNQFPDVRKMLDYQKKNGGVRVETKELLIRIMKKLDYKNRLLLPKIIMDNIKAKDYYVELYDDGSIALVPIKK